MNPDHMYVIDSKPIFLKKCENPECHRLVIAGLIYCCGGCGEAHYRKYEIHETGILGHSETCNERHESRKNLRRF
jgi:hypothetical protein